MFGGQSAPRFPNERATLVAAANRSSTKLASLSGDKTSTPASRAERQGNDARSGRARHLSPKKALGSSIWTSSGARARWHASRTTGRVSSAVASPSKGSNNDLTVPIGVVAIIMMMVLPMPPFLVDVLLAVSMALAIGVFLIGLLDRKSVV